MRTASTGAVGAVLIALALAGCGGGSKPSSEAKTSESSYGSSSTSSTASAAASSETAVTVKSNATLGSILAAGPKKLTVYMFVADHRKSPTCYGACASAWPPVTTTGKPTASGGVSSSQLGTIKRSDGTTQVTYAGYPLYYYSPDTTEEAITGQGVTSFGAPWYVLSPSGQVIKKT
jgi:predicted lipoprotein with Yx(FWY)xxD motif